VVMDAFPPVFLLPIVIIGGGLATRGMAHAVRSDGHVRVNWGRGITFVAYMLLFLSALASLAYPVLAQGSIGIGDTFDPQTGPITIYYWDYPGSEVFIIPIVLGVLGWAILLLVAKAIEKSARNL
jgi:hypothetical protein